MTIKTFDIQIVADAETAELKSVSAFSYEGRINSGQHKSIVACQAYCAHLANTTAAMVEDLLCMSFDVESSRELPFDRYEEAMVWLVDFDLKKFIQ